MTTTTEQLDTALSTVLTQQTRTDSKAGLLLTLNSILVAGLAAGAGRLSTPAAAVAAVAAVAIVTSAALAVLVMRPRLGGADRGSFTHWATLTDDKAVLDVLREDRRAANLRIMSRITLRKMELLRRAADTTLVAVGILAVSAVIAAIG